jgi:hypothetical protein
LRELAERQLPRPRPIVAAVAKGAEPGVYSGGVLGHDHLAGIASSGGDFNVICEPTVVVFTSVQAAAQHITTLAQVNADVAGGRAILIPLPQADNCSVVSAAAYARGTPAPTIPGTLNPPAPQPVAMARSTGADGEGTGPAVRA